MQLQQLFAKDINRDIQGVIKVGQDAIENQKQELEEYVVTTELEKHFKQFFKNYRKGIDGTSQKMGVWISGFFGSGKSHFLKILSYLLKNEDIDGKKAIDYFLDEGKFTSPELLADIQRSLSVSTDVILFNIDSRSSALSKSNKDGLVEVFNAMFNEMQGYSADNPYIADLEQELNKKGVYADFQQAFERLVGESWLEGRSSADFYQDDIVEALQTVGFSETSARHIFDKMANIPYDYKISKFAERIKKYLATKPDNHHIVFFVDEVGQYIGSNSNLMLNLQTITEDLGSECEGKVWLVVTSQQNIDEVTKVKGNDFSKIQGRFDTRLSLTSGNVQEVIEKRILLKNAEGHDALTELYSQKETILKNLLVFNDGQSRKLYQSSENFAAVYPFIPYQFELIGLVLNSIRTHGASGKHLSQGERSMLAIFQQSLQTLQHQDVNTLVPLYYTYDALQQFLDHSHSNVITRALNNDAINPLHVEDCFAVSVLKTLFLVKYVKNFTATKENITTLMVSHIDDDRVTLQQQVTDALKVLESQTFIQRSNDGYIFLTDEEQEINREIDNRTVDSNELSREVSELLFDDLYSEKQYSVPRYKGKYRFSFNQILDGQSYRANQNHELSLKVLTPDSEERYESDLSKIGEAGTILVVLPEDKSYLEELKWALKIEKFLKDGNTANLRDYDEIRLKKQRERDERRSRSRTFLKDALDRSTLYVNGEPIDSSSRDFKTKMTAALEKLVAESYNKLSYIDTPMTMDDLQHLLTQSGQQEHLDGITIGANEDALLAVQQYIFERVTQRKQQVTLKSLIDAFHARPYGFNVTDIEWLVTKHFVDGTISLQLNKEYLTRFSMTTEQLRNYLTKVDYSDKIVIEIRHKANETEKAITQELAKVLFNVYDLGESDDEMMLKFRMQAISLRDELHRTLDIYKRQPRYPGQAIVEEGIKLLQSLLNLQQPSQFFTAIKSKEDDLLDFAEDYTDINNFFKGKQKELFDRTFELIAIYEKSRGYITEGESIEQIVQHMTAITKLTSPYREVPKLEQLREAFNTAYSDILEAHLGAVIGAIHLEEETDLKTLEQSDPALDRDKFGRAFKKDYQALEDKAHRSTNIVELLSYKTEANMLRTNQHRRAIEVETQRLLLECKRAAQQDKQAAAKAADAVTPVTPDPTPVPPVKKTKHVSIHQVNPASTWEIRTKDDVQRYVAALSKQLERVLEDDTTIYIDF